MMQDNGTFLWKFCNHVFMCNICRELNLLLGSHSDEALLKSLAHTNKMSQRQTETHENLHTHTKLQM